MSHVLMERKENPQIVLVSYNDYVSVYYVFIIIILGGGVVPNASVTFNAFFCPWFNPR